MKEQIELCEALARQIVARYREEAPEGYDPQGFDVGGGDTESDTKFRRTGTSSSKRTYELPGGLSSLLTQSFGNSSVSPALQGAESNYLISLLSRSAGNVPGLSTLNNAMGIDPQSFQGGQGLETMMARNPYSADYENATSQLYNRQFNQARAAAQSGPTNVRGGTARQGFELADVGTQQAINRFREVRGQQDKEAGVVQGAVQLFNTIEQMRRGSQMQAQQQRMAGELGRDNQQLDATGAVGRMRTNNIANITTASELLGAPKSTTTDNLSGKGQQAGSSSHWGAGITCCHILLEALNGNLPDYVRRGRDEFCSPNRRRGYNWTANWLVPLMRKSRLVLHAVNWSMVKWFLWHGKAFYVTKNLLVYLLTFPVVWGWLLAWEAIGLVTEGEYKDERNTANAR